MIKGKLESKYAAVMYSGARQDFFRFFKGELAYGVFEPHPISDSEKKLNLSLCLRPPNNVGKGNLRSCSYRL